MNTEHINVKIDKEIKDEVKRRIIDTGETMTQFVERALRELLKKEKRE